MKAPWYMRDARIERGPDGPRMTSRPHPLWLAWAALCVAAKRLRLTFRGRS